MTNERDNDRTIFLKDETTGRLSNRLNPPVQWFLLGQGERFVIGRDGNLYGDSYFPMRYMDEFRFFFRTNDEGVEGFEWHHPDGRTARILKSDFGDDVDRG